MAGAFNTPHTHKKHYERIAEVCHEINKIYCETLGDMSQSPWLYADDNLKASAIDGVAYSMEHNTCPEKSHENWRRFRDAEGWTYGEEKNYDKKEHPCMIDYDKLPVEQRNKDMLFTIICDGFKEVLK